ncbi:MAG: ABC transporter permease [Acidobacteriaceae bacterium]|nr:ABC transporter permease [Acidobacteriaceae bacterium]MBV9226204.1 ABC transporter permease [Acidobacteriaceae bacterium]MBV9306980.1 ABC transporter permease [Acidobacteriaceae bacterium]MBV9678245.1 ABC transporter permease [Acidobacteriaceae bacterium]
MLWYKAWRESQARFLLSAGTIAGLCVAFVVFHREGAPVADHAQTYAEYIWRIVYKGYLRELFVLLALLLGVGGLLRERDYGTAPFTLALPVSRWHLLAVRAAVGIVEVTILSLLPAVILPALSPLMGEVYPWSQAWQFGLLWSIGGAFLFSMGFLASIFFAGEYTAAVVAVLAMLSYSVAVELPVVERYVPDVHDLMSGVGMPYFRLDTYHLVGPLPWTTLGGLLLLVGSSFALAGRLTQRQDF